jgi:thioredoxin 1
VLNNDVTVVVNFHADWCKPCLLLTPKLVELVVPLLNVDLVNVDVEKCPELVNAFDVKAIPAVVAVRSGIVVDKFIGLVDVKNIEDFITKISAQARTPVLDAVAKSSEVENL